jgi:hypothetical protein
VTPTPTGVVSIVGDVVTFDTDETDCPDTFTITVCVTDGNLDDCCTFTVEVLCRSRLAFRSRRPT